MAITRYACIYDFQTRVGRLSAQHRVVVTLFALDGLSHKAIAEILGIPEGTVWSRLHHARKKLAQLFAVR